MSAITAAPLPDPRHPPRRPRASVVLVLSPALAAARESARRAGVVLPRLLEDRP